PASPQIFYGRESELQEIVSTLKQDFARIAILGTGGMGKTSLAIAALQHSDIAGKFANRFFIPCHSTATRADLIASIASHLGVHVGPNLARKVVRHLSYGPPTLLILDNFETPWEPTSSRPGVEEFLSLLTDVPHVALIITMRGAERPSRVKWTRPFLQPLQPLDDEATLKTFLDIADNDYERGTIRELLNLTGNLPLAVSLIANVVVYEGCDATLLRWRTERTRVLSDGYDKKSSLDISIMLSFTSARMTAEAQELLSILSLLPDGLSDADLTQSNLPIENILSAKATLIRTSLAYTGRNHRLLALVPIREHIRAAHPPSPELKFPLRQYFHEL
ncbi:P-loop containing nucleoside triphosphate hydrolase protein, partial [Mycena vulgaris]